MTNDEMIAALSKRGFNYTEHYGLVFYKDFHFANVFAYKNGDIFFYVVNEVDKELHFDLKPSYVKLQPELHYIDKKYFENYLDEWIKLKKNKDIELRKKELTKDFN